MVVGVGGAGSGAEARTQRENSFLVDWNGPGGQSTGFGVATNCHAMGTRKKRRRKSCHSIYEREQLASYIPIAKPFLRSHSSAFGGVQLSASRPAVLRRGAVPVRCRSGEVLFRHAAVRQRAAVSKHAPV